MRIRHLLVAVLVPWAVVAQDTSAPPNTLPESAAGALSRSLDAAQTHAAHVWRDTAPLNDDGTVNAYIEIAQGDRRKWEFDMGANARAIDRMMPDGLEYPIAYGFVPQTVSYDGDPFDALVLGPAIAGGQLVRGVIVGLMLMEDEKGLDSKVVLAAVDGRGRPVQELSADDRDADRRLLRPLQGARTRQVFASARMGLQRAGTGICHDDARVLSEVS